MIRAGRTEFVVDRKGLAELMGVKWGTFRTVQPYTAPGFPDAISSAGAQVLLWDRQQVEAHLAHRTMPALPLQDSDDDLLDRQEAAAMAGVQPRSWDGYKKDPRLATHTVKVCRVEHWPRGIVQRFTASRGVPSQPPGRPTGSGDMVPRDLLPGRIAKLLDADPAVTAAHTVDVLGVSVTTAQKHLAQARGARIADLLRVEPALDPEEAAVRLGFPAAVRRTAIALALQLQTDSAQH
ncbi:hypothetical protein ABZ934_32315 [Streptomyces sp. NPDC046557]|uniref:hypothetical protein n=1 Tax=Streptomyces sp. NPDC046557 TaxID=3155372 RepID=UPI0033D6C019